MTPNAPDNLTDWQKRHWKPGMHAAAAHPNSRFTVSASQCPCIAPEWDDPNGVPISAIIFGGRRTTTIPLVTEAFDWNHGVFLGSVMASETTAAADGALGKLRFDPMAMLPFCGYNMADYFEHWLKMGIIVNKDTLPKIFSVNWFRRNESGAFIWPGFSENIRVLKWIFDRVDGKLPFTIKTPIGYLPRIDDLDLASLNVSKQDMQSILNVDNDDWRDYIAQINLFYKRFENRIPIILQNTLHDLEESICEK
jgi:phosphoenolpyruvate carboxykinase (GTP)